jgi:hypothetical protein
MPDLDRATTLKSSLISIPREPDWIPKGNWRLHTKLWLEGAQWRRGVQSPIAVGTSGKAIWKEKHADVGHYGQTPVRELDRKTLFLHSSLPNVGWWGFHPMSPGALELQVSSPRPL